MPWLTEDGTQDIRWRGAAAMIALLHAPRLTCARPPPVDLRCRRHRLPVPRAAGASAAADLPHRELADTTTAVEPGAGDAGTCRGAPGSHGRRIARWPHARTPRRTQRRTVARASSTGARDLRGIHLYGSRHRRAHRDAHD